MKLRFLQLTTICAMLLGSATARADLVNFDFTATNGGGLLVTGVIEGLTVGGSNVSPSAVYITGYSGMPAFAFPTPLLIDDFSGVGGVDLFSVDTSGNLIAANFNGNGAYVTGCAVSSCYVNLVINTTGNAAGHFTGGVFQYDPLQNGGDFAGDFVQSVTAVPEPSTWAMMILGFAAIGFMAYRRSPVLALVAGKSAG